VQRYEVTSTTDIYRRPLSAKAYRKGASPLGFFEDIRVEHARHMIALGKGLEQIANDVGYADTAKLRTLMRKRLGNGLRDVRGKLALTS
jgi:AraC-like DNA-binding protein